VLFDVSAIETIYIYIYILLAVAVGNYKLIKPLLDSAFRWGWFSCYMNKLTGCTFVE
jgi:hypothetical protein